MSVYMGGKLARLSSLQVVASGVLQRSLFFSDLDSGEKTVSLSLQMIAKCGVQLVRMRAGLLFRGSWRGRDLCKPHEVLQG